MIVRLQALRSLRWSYKRRGVWVWLKGRQQCQRCAGRGRVPLGVTPGLVGLTASPASFTARACPTYGGEKKVRVSRLREKAEAEVAEDRRKADERRTKRPSGSASSTKTRPSQSPSS